MLELLCIPYSPWSEQARWALDARAIEYSTRTYQPVLGELGLRLLLKRPFGRVGVPVLCDGERVIYESLAIARYADQQGAGLRLFPDGREDEILAHAAAAERGLCAGRALSLTRMLGSREALEEQVPERLRAMLGPLSSSIARAGVERTLRKYRANGGGLTDHHAMLASVLLSLRADLARHPGAEPRALLSAFSYADIAMSQVLAYVEPPQSRHFQIGKATRRCFRDAKLREQFSDLVAWRDSLYARYRDQRPTKAQMANVHPQDGTPVLDWRLKLDELCSRAQSEPVSW